MGFLCGSAGKESTCNAGDLGSTPVLGISSGEGRGYPLQCSGLENSMDCVVHGIEESGMTERFSLSHTMKLKDLNSRPKKCLEIRVVSLELCALSANRLGVACLRGGDETQRGPSHPKQGHHTSAMSGQHSRVPRSMSRKPRPA